MEIKPIKTKRDYRGALKEIEGLMHAKRNTPAGDRLDVLVILVEAWEAIHYPLDLPDPIEAIKYHMEQKGLSPHDLIPLIGGRNRVYDVLARKRPLTSADIEDDLASASRARDSSRVTHQGRAAAGCLVDRDMVRAERRRERGCQ